jgi:hypothetical protein
MTRTLCTMLALLASLGSSAAYADAPIVDHPTGLNSGPDCNKATFQGSPVAMSAKTIAGLGNWVTLTTLVAQGKLVAVETKGGINCNDKSKSFPFVFHVYEAPPQ